MLKISLQTHGPAQGGDFGRRKRAHAARSQIAQIHRAFGHTHQAQDSEAHVAAHAAYLAVQALVQDHFKHYAPA